ncbi:MAG: response regulator [Chthoniobacterales bacterium]
MTPAVPIRRLLVVDDEPLVRQTLSLCLKHDYEVTAVASGEEALRLASTEAFPVVLLDLCMEGLSGIETLKRLKEIREFQNVIILTAHESTETAIAAVNLGAFNYLTKPFERRHLEDVISRGFADYERQAMRKQEMQTRLMSVHDAFFSLLCHEFNTPLNVVLGYAELLAQGADDAEEAGWIQEIQKSGEQLHEVLMEIVDYVSASHLAASGMNADFLPETLFASVLAASREKGLDVEFHDFSDSGGCFSGPDRSILMIARKILRMASLQSKSVRLTVHCESALDDGLVELTLTTEGTNSDSSVKSEAEMASLFEPYAASKLGAARSGLGLELATCRKVAEYAKGTVVCQLSPAGVMQFVARIPVRRVG